MVTHCRELADKVIAIVNEQYGKLSEKRREFIKTNFNTYGGVILTESLKESIDFVNEYAPEHMEVMTRQPFDILPMIKNAGESFWAIILPLHFATTFRPQRHFAQAALQKPFPAFPFLDF